MLLQRESGALAPAAINLTPPRQTESIIHPLPPTRPVSTTSDSALPMLDAALDNGIMTGHLRSRLSLLAQTHNATVSGSRLLDCKPGKRALVRYELTASRPHRKTVVFGKVYSQMDQLMRIDQVMDKLWTDLFADDSVCGTPQPLGVIPELSMLLYLPAEGAFLDEVLAEREGTQAMQLTARWLAALHSHPLQLTKRFDLDNELKNLASWTALVGQTYAEMAGLAHELLSYLQQQAQTISLQTDTLIHKDFHYRHVLVGRGVKVIDFDEMRLGDPNFDLAHFCANLHLLSYRQHGTPYHFRERERQLLHTYVRHVGPPWSDAVQSNLERFRFFYVYTCIKIARQLCLGFGPGPAPVGDERRRQVEMILKQGAKRL